MTPLIRNLMRRKYVWSNDRTDRKDRSRWCRVIAQRIVKDRLIVLAQSGQHGDHVVFTWLTNWNNRRSIPSDSWGGSLKSGYSLYWDAIHHAEYGHYRGQTRRKCCQPWRRRMKYDPNWHIS